MRLMILLSSFFFIFNSFAGEIKLMAYNVHNLFDTTHEKGKNDWAFLPKSYPGKMDNCRKMKSFYRKKECLQTDWNDSKLLIKINQIKKAIKLGGELDIIGLVEVENQFVVDKLKNKINFRNSIVTESQDARGIDVALLYNESKDLKFVSRKRHVLSGNVFIKKPTRDILEVEFLVQGKYPLFVFVNHWPSLANPDETRVMAANLLKSRIDFIKTQKSEASFVAMGDFNTIPDLKNGSTTHPLRDVLLKDESLVDLDAKVRSSQNLKDGLMMGKGTYYYKKDKKWNMLDRFFVNDSLYERSSGLRYKKGSYKILNDLKITREYKVTKEMIPYSYNHKAVTKVLAGYSDHFPIIMSLQY